MPVFHITLKRQDPHSDAYEISTGDVGAEDATEALAIFRESADVFGHSDWSFASMECEIRDDMIMEGEEEDPPKRSWLCRLLCR